MGEIIVRIPLTTVVFLLVSSFILPISHYSTAECPDGDLTSDCTVNLDDLAEMAGQWLDSPGCWGLALCADVVGNDGVNLDDFALLSRNWLEEGVPNGSVKVNISPIGAVAALAQWRIDKGPWRDSSDIADVPIIRYLDFLLFIYSRNQNTLPLTAKGRYRHTVVDTFNRELFPYNKSLLKVGSEDYSLALRQVHSLLKKFSFVDENASSSRLNPRGLELFAEKNYQKYYLEFLKYALYEADWVDYLPIASLQMDHFRFFQKTALFSFLLLKNKAVSFVDHETLYDIFCRAFPSFNIDKSREESLLILPALYKVLFLINFSHVHGLVEYNIEEEMINVIEDPLFRTTKLFKKLFTWQV